MKPFILPLNFIQLDKVYYFLLSNIVSLCMASWLHNFVSYFGGNNITYVIYLSYYITLESKVTSVILLVFIMYYLVNTV